MTAIADRVTADAPADAAVPDKASGEGRLYGIDVLRFGAAMMVLVFHFCSVAPLIFSVDAKAMFGPLLWQASRYGFMGVQLFFMVSGFVICMSSWGRSLSAFVTSRVTRLMPAYLFAVIVTALIPAMFGSKWRVTPNLYETLANLTMTQTMLGITNVDGVYWTLLVELKFYLLFAAVVWFGVTYRRVVLFCVAWSTAALFATLTDSKLLGAVLEPGQSSFFIAGITLYLIHRFGPNLLLWGLLTTSWIFSVIVMMRAVDDTNAYHASNPGNASDPSYVLSNPRATLLVTCFYLVMTAAAMGWLSWLRWRGLMTVGALTYPLYLLHIVVAETIWYRLDGLISDRWLVLLAVPAVLGVAFLVYRYVERPAAKVISRGLKKSFAQIRANP